MKKQKTITVISSKKFTFNGKHYCSDGGFGKVIEGLAKHFDKVVLAVPVKKVIKQHGYVINSRNVKYFPLPFYNSYFGFIKTLPKRWLNIVKVCREEKQTLHLWLPGYESVIAYLYREGKKVITYVGGDWGWISLFSFRKSKTLSKVYSWFNHTLTRWLCDNTYSFLVGDDLYNKYRRNIFKTSTSTLLSEDVGDFRETCQSKPVRLLYVGRLSKEKAVRAAVDAVESLNFHSIPARLSLVGEGPEKESLQSEYVDHLGYVSQGESLRKVYDSHDIFVFPSYENSVAKVVVEAMARSLPVVCSNAGAAPEGSTCYFVKPDNSKQIVEGVKSLMKDVKFRRVMCFANLELAKGHCIDKIMLDRLKKAEVLK